MVFTDIFLEPRTLPIHICRKRREREEREREGRKEGRKEEKEGGRVRGRKWGEGGRRGGREIVMVSSDSYASQDSAKLI